MDSEASQTEALAFLQDIEDRHNRVLDGLDELNRRIEAVLSTQSTSRSPEASPPSRD